ncbi:MAG: EAL domain-containing protein [Acidimicrobiales bacterium]|nr:EAL domain-containing protein [Acidimicrobiales bacterium]
MTDIPVSNDPSSGGTNFSADHLNQDLLKSLVDAAPTGAAHLDSQGSAVQVNGRWEVTTGQPAGDALGGGWTTDIDPDGRAEFLTALTRSLGDSKGLRGRLRFLTVDGTTRWMDLTITPLAPAGKPNSGALLTVVNVSDEMDEARRAHELTRVLEATPDPVAVLDPSGEYVVWANDALQRNSAITPALPGEPVRILDLLDGWSQAQYATAALPTVRSEGIWRGELRLLSNSGTVPISAVLVTHSDEEGAVDAISVMGRDLTDLHAAQERVEASEIRLAALVEHASDLVCVIGDNARIIYASPAVAHILGREAHELEGIDVTELVHPDDLKELAARAAEVVAQPGMSPAVEARVAHGEGGWRHMEIVATNLLGNPAVAGVVVNARDVTERVEVAAQLEERAYHDELTGLPNRALLLDRLQDALHRAARHDRMVGVLFLDLDRFKVVNDSLGHGVGDDLLREAAQRLERTIRPGDLVARLGGDEFVVVISDMVRATDALAAAERVRTALARPVEFGTDTTVMSASVGIAIARGVETPADLLRDADTAMYRAKEAGRDRAVMFGAHLRAQAVRRHSVEQELRSALDEERIEVHFQPVIRLTDATVVGAEALARIRGSGGELLQPSQFIDIAEDTGLIADLGARVLTIAVSRLAAWQIRDSARLTGESLSIAVNVSARQLADPMFPRLVASTVVANGIDPTQLALEFTESALIAANPVTGSVLGELTALGVRMGLDDFGTGFSSLAYLKRFPIDFLKIDRSFVAGLREDEARDPLPAGDRDGDDTAIVTGTIALAHSLGLRVVAEGVETEEQLRILRHLRCDQAQGFYFSEPVTDAEFDRFLGPGLSDSSMSQN